MDYNASKAELIRKLKTQNDSISKILALNGYSLIDADIKSNLIKIQTEAQEIIRKLENNEFQIAVVGLEKAGKSSFCNALIENNMLPTKQGRCTYTATSIISSKESKAEITFYTKQEFEADLRDKLSKLGIEGYESFSLNNIDDQTYGKFYDKVTSEKKSFYGETINKEIEDIITYKKQIAVNLDRPAITLLGDNINDELYNYIVAPEKAMAVKEVIIQSPLLDKMPNAIIYDVPGFNSPTARHMQQTQERMYKADAIVMVATANRPSITPEQLKPFKDCDNDGTSLSDKLFIFENMADLATLQENIPLIYSEWGEKNKIQYDHNRFFFGSSNARLQQIGKLPADQDNDCIKSMKKKLAMLDSSLSDVKEKSSEENGFGIVSLREALESYNQNERMKVLQSRAGRLQNRMREVLEPLMEQTSDEDNANNFIDQTMLSKFMRDFSEKIGKELNDYRDMHKNETLSNNLLSKDLIEYISNNIKSDQYSDFVSLELESAKKSLGIISDNKNTMNVSEVESKVRTKLFSQMYEQDFADKMEKIVIEQHNNLSKNLLDVFMNALGVKTDSKFYESLKDKLSAELAPFLDNTNNANYYRSLIERYSRDIYELLIGQNYSLDRYERFIADIGEYYSMSVYYDNSIDADKPKDAKSLGSSIMDNGLCRQMLCHDYTVKKVNSAIEDAKNKAMTALRVDKLPENIISLVVSIAKCDIIGAGTKIIDVLNNITDPDEINRISAAKSQLTFLSQSCNSDQSIYTADLTNQESFRKTYQSYFSPKRNYEDVICFIKEDIDILQDVMLHCFVRALDLEKPYVARMYLIISNLKDYIKTDPFYDFIGKSIPMIRPDEVETIESKRLEQEMNAACRKEVTNIINAMGK